MMLSVRARSLGETRLEERASTPSRSRATRRSRPSGESCRARSGSCTPSRSVRRRAPSASARARCAAGVCVRPWTCGRRKRCGRRCVDRASKVNYRVEKLTSQAYLTSCRLAIVRLARIPAGRQAMGCGSAPIPGDTYREARLGRRAGAPGRRLEWTQKHVRSVERSTGRFVYPSNGRRVTRW